MSTQTNLTVSYAPYPFDASDGDIILRTPDGVHFRIYKLLLSLASTVFKDMFSMVAQSDGSNEIVDGLPVLDVTEKSSTIKNLLLWCYPASLTGSPDVAKSSSDIGNLLEASRKYDIPGLQMACLQFIRKPQFIGNNPLQVFAIAYRQRNEALARLAARYIVLHGFLKGGYAAELEMIDAGGLYRVLSYRKRCIDTAVDVAVNHRWITDGQYRFLHNFPDEMDNLSPRKRLLPVAETPSTERRGRNNANGSSGVLDLPSYFRLQTQQPFSEKNTTITTGNGREISLRAHLWWAEFMEDTAVALRSSASGRTVKDSGRMAAAMAAAQASAGSCFHCRPFVRGDIEKFVNSFAEKVEARMTGITLELPFTDEKRK